MKKINSVHFGPEMILIGIALLILFPGVAWMIKGKFYWYLCVPGAFVLFAFALVFMIEMKQDGAEVPYYEAKLKENIPFDPVNQRAVIKASICNGEKVAGFKDKKTGHFTEVMVLRSDAQKDRFMKLYGITELPTEY